MALKNKTLDSSQAHFQPSLKSKLGLDLFQQPKYLKEFDPPKVELHSAWIVVLMITGLGMFGAVMTNPAELFWPATIGSFCFSLLFAVPYAVQGWLRARAPQFEVSIAPDIPEVGDKLKIDWQWAGGNQPRHLTLNLRCEQWYFRLPLGAAGGRPLNDTLYDTVIQQYQATVASDVPILGRVHSQLPSALRPSVFHDVLAKAALPQLPPFWLLEFSGRCGLARRRFTRVYLLPKFPAP